MVATTKCVALDIVKCENITLEDDNIKTVLLGGRFPTIDTF